MHAPASEDARGAGQLALALDPTVSPTPEPASPAAFEASSPASPPRPDAGALDWDTFLASAPGGDHVQSSGWGEVKRFAGMTPSRTVVRREGRIVAGAQILMRSIPLLGRVGYVPLGPVCADPSPALAAAAIEELRRAMRQHRIRALIVQPPDGGEALVTQLMAVGALPTPVEVAPSATLRARLTPDLDALFDRMRSSVRRNVRQTERANVAVRELRLDEVETFYRLHSATAERQSFEPMPLERLRELMETLGPSGGARIFVAELDGQPMASALLTCFGTTLTYKLPGSEPAGKLRPGDVLHWQIMRWAALSGFETYDLGGVPRGYALDLLEGREPGDYAERGSADFKRGFGGEPVVLPQAYVWIPNPLLRMAFRAIASRPGLTARVRGWLNRVRRN